jgi:hypothetical protein
VSIMPTLGKFTGPIDGEVGCLWCSFQCAVHYCVFTCNTIINDIRILTSNNHNQTKERTYLKLNAYHGDLLILTNVTGCFALCRILASYVCELLVIHFHEPC